MNIISLNGRLQDSAEARISIDERGFRFGDGVFETIPVYSGVPYLLPYHLARLQTGLAALKIEYKTASLTPSVSEVIAANRMEQGVVRIYVSRGIGSQGYLPVSPAPSPTLLIQPLPMPQIPGAPVTLWLSTWEKISPRALPTESKLAQGLNATLARMEAREHGCYDALQQSAVGHVSEASSANIFWLKQGVLYTPALSTGALAGVTRRRLMELVSTPVREGEFTLQDMRGAEAVFLTNAACGIVPVSSLQPLGFTWESSEAAKPFAALRQKDIAAAS